MFRKLMTLILIVPIAVVLIILCVANRTPVSVTLDPINPGNPAVTASIPLFILLILVALIGVVLGSIMTWVKQGKHRKAKRKAARHANELKREADALNAERQNLLNQEAHKAGDYKRLPAI